MRVEGFEEEFSGLIPRDTVRWAFSDADLNGFNKVIFVFRVEESALIRSVNLVINYAPFRGEILWGAVEIVISGNLPVKDFFKRTYINLLKANFEVLVDASGIYVVKKLGRDLTSNKVLDVVREVCNAVKDKCGTVVFVRAIPKS